MNVKRLVVWVMTQALLVTQTGALAQSSHDQGVAAGQAANTAIRGMVNQPSATSVVPGYTTTPPEAALAGRPALGPDVSAKLAACAATPNDPSCQALRTAITSANTARPTISPSDPAVAAASRIARNPSLDLGSLAAYYSGCTTTDTTIATHTETRVCARYVTAGSYSCSNALNVAVARSTNCTAGDWFAQASSGSTAVAAQCLPDRPDTSQHFRVTSSGNPLAFFDVDMTTPVVTPQRVAVIGTTYNWPSFTPAERGVYVADKSCSGTTCSLTAMIADDPVESCTGGWDSMTCVTIHPFVDVYAACPAGTQSGDNLLTTTCSYGGDGMECTTSALSTTTCYSPGSPGDTQATDVTGTYASSYWRASSTRGVVGWAPNPAYGPIPQMRLSYTKPSTLSTATDTWNNQCPGLAADSRCAVASAPICVDGPSTKVIDGVPVTRDCWQYQSTMSCSGTFTADQCAPLVAAGCTPLSSTCSRTNPATGVCEAYQDQYSCTVPNETVTQATNCPTNVFCLGTSCFNTAYTNDADFARTMSMLEATREAGVYIDSDRMQVFKGEANSCRDRLLTNCCNSDASGRGMTNQSVFGAGSRLVYDILMNSENRQFVYQGLSALLTGAGFSGSFTSYGVTIAVNGTALPAGSTVLYSSSTVAGEGFVIAVDPWTLVIAAVIYIVLSLTSCNENEAFLALKEGAGLCHSIGSYCSSCIRILGSCVSCIEHTTGKCCFNSMLARIVNEQGRGQIAKGWGSAQSPDCSGFTIAQLQSLDFARMDLSEFYASLVAKSPNLAVIQNNNGARVPNCYFGQGKCQ
jgi:conjugal transfer mating pair stabilization protein TraN